MINKIASILTKRKKTINWPLLNALDANYLKGLQLNWHMICKDVLQIINTTAGLDFGNFRDERNRADYDLDMTFNHTNSKCTVDQIKNLISLIPKL